MVIIARSMEKRSLIGIIFILLSFLEYIFAIAMNQSGDIGGSNRAWGSDRWSDGEAFDHHLKLQVFSFTTNPITKEVYPDADGRRARLAKNARASEYICWRSYFAEIGETCPDFLMEPMT